ncbi:hypothetical protein HMPREF0758_0919 [Serratia odorifera DSM 4582]|uniref:Uncharacterized protein n=1 Tax=Serratia odorifera DSM 4582 TaxID=667129 RepID=D4DXU6_SEROD|nr:hypothetical protein HMPREF0758_0919 [Serratia odorifera DSM 4582]
MVGEYIESRDGNDSAIIFLWFEEITNYLKACVFLSGDHGNN